MPLLIKGFQKLSLIDYPDKLCATIFVGNCNFRCGYCYNKDLVLHADQLSTITENWVLDFLESRKTFLDGLCIGGGEPTLHDDLPNFLIQVKKLGYAIKLDTNGSNSTMLQQLISRHLIDYCAMDIKAPLQKYAQVTSVPVNIASIKRSIKILKKGDIDYEFRTTVTPDILTLEDITELVSDLQTAKRYVIQQFVPGHTLDNTLQRQYSAETLEALQIQFAPFFQECLLRS
jgi:pyruvate formate lyase activating enzyme